MPEPNQRAEEKYLKTMKIIVRLVRLNGAGRPTRLTWVDAGHEA
jgi:hypothetical protein